MAFDSPEVNLLQGLLFIFVLFPLHMIVYLDIMQAQQLNKEIFETIYYHALKTSCGLAAKEGPYETYSGSPISKVYNGFQCPPIEVLSESIYTA